MIKLGFEHYQKKKSNWIIIIIILYSRIIEDRLYQPFEWLSISTSM